MTAAPAQAPAGAPATPELLAGLQQQATEIAAAGDADAAYALLAVASQLEPGAVGAVALARALVALTSALDPPAPLRALGGTLRRAVEVCAAQPEAPVGELVAMIEQLAVVAGRAGDMDAQTDNLVHIVRFAAGRPEPPDATAASVYLRVRDWCETSGLIDHALALETALLRHVMHADGLPDGGRASWLSNHVVLLERWQREAQIPASLALAEAAARAQGWPLTLSACRYLQARELDAEGRWEPAATAYEQALAPSGLLAKDRIGYHSLAARAWFRAADFDASARHSREAILLRVATAAPHDGRP